MAAARPTSRVKSKPSKTPSLGPVVCQKSGSWWAAWMPSFPGAYGQGRTREAAYQSMRSAICDAVDTYMALSRKRARRVA